VGASSENRLGIKEKPMERDRGDEQLLVPIWLDGAGRSFREEEKEGAK